MGLFRVGKDTKATNQANKEINQANIDASYEMLRRQQEYADKQWDRDTAYNGPSAQADRYRAAGFNPYFMMSQGNTNTASSMAGGSGSVPAAIPMQNPAAEKQGRMASLNNSIQSLNDSIQGLAMRRNMEADSNLKNAQATNINLGNQFVAQKARQDIAESVSRVKRNDAARDKDNFDVEFGMHMQPYNLQKSQNDVRAQERNEKLLDLMIQEKEGMIPLLKEEQRAKIANLWQSIEESKARQKDYEESGQLKAAQREYENEKKIMQQFENDIHGFSKEEKAQIRNYIMNTYEKDSYVPGGILGSGLNYQNINRTLREGAPWLYNW